MELTEIPATFTAGTTVKYRRSFTDYPANQSWTLEVWIVGAGEQKISAKAAGGDGTVVPDGADFLVTFPAAATAKLTPSGIHRWVELVTKAGETFEAASGILTVTPNLATAYPGEIQSYNERVLAALKAKLEGRITKDQESFQIDGTALARIPVEQLGKLIADFEARVASERRGGAPRRPLQAAFTPVGTSIGRPWELW